MHPLSTKCQHNLDTNSLIIPSQGPYRFSMLPQFWRYLEKKAAEQVIGSSSFVLQELLGGKDELETWSRQQRGILFREPDQAVQESYGRIAESVRNNPGFAAHHVTRFLSGADPWLIAHANTHGGRVVTFEKSEPNSKKPKIPDVGTEFNVECIKIWDMLTELNAQF